VHIVQLIGLRNRLLVLINWAWDYFLYDRAVRLIFAQAAAERKLTGAVARPLRFNPRCS
jgi:NADH dehydrogenase